ncbi:MAG: transglutaminase-like domain-containing protein [Planctomycetota bacterium]|jgi:transglutaminase-like putative cysteine protease
MKGNAFFLAGLLCLSTATAQPVHTNNRPNHDKAEEKIIQTSIVEMGLIYDFNTADHTDGIRFLVMLPHTIPGRQKILGIKYSPKPTNLFSNNGLRYAEFSIENPPKQFRIQIDINARLFRYDLTIAKQNGQQADPMPSDLAEFLKNERWMEKDNPKIKQIANSIEGKDETEILRNIFDYVADNMEYVVTEEANTGALYALKQKKGDCSEYSDLFVALCRARRIPARFVTGYTVRFDEVTPKHHWAEVYLRKYGWVPVDPSWSDVEDKAFRTTALETMRPVYVYLTHFRGDAVMNNNHYFSYIYWGDKPELTDSTELRQITELLSGSQ